MELDKSGGASRQPNDRIQAIGPGQASGESQMNQENSQAHDFCRRQRAFSMRSGVPGQTLRQSLSVSPGEVMVNEILSGTYQLFNPVRLTSL